MAKANKGGINNNLSKRIIEFLHSSKTTYTVYDIADIAKTTPKYLYEIIDGKKCFKDHHIKNICKQEPLIFGYILKDLTVEVVGDKISQGADIAKEKFSQGADIAKEKFSDGAGVVEKSTHTFLRIACSALSKIVK